MKNFYPITNRPTTFRDEDAWGSGAFGAPRGERLHRGVDIVAAAGEVVLSPLTGTIVREAAPYDDDPRFTGLLICGADEWEGYEVKLFYVEGRTSGSVRAGDPIGNAQDLSLKYPGITNHVHLEVWCAAEVLDPTTFLSSTGPMATGDA